MFITQEAHLAPDIPSRQCRRDARAAVSRRDGAGADAARAGRRRAPLQRFGFVYVPHGSIMKDWTPAQEGAGFEFSPILKPLERFRDQLTVLTGLTNNGENGHSPSTAMWLSGTFPAKGSVIHLDTTVDQIIAQKIGQETTFPSIELATEDHSSHLGSCAGDFLCSYMSTISLAHADAAAADGDQPARRVRADVRRRRRHARGAARAAGAEHQHPRRGRRERRATCSAASGPRDRAKLDRVPGQRPRDRAADPAGRAAAHRHLLDAPPTPIGVPEIWEEHVKLMFDLMALAFQGDLTRVTSFMMARELSTLSYPQIGVADGHHPVSHNNGVRSRSPRRPRSTPITWRCSRASSTG